MDGLNITNERITAEDLDRLQDWHLRDERTRLTNTVEDFKNAPVGATATNPETGSRAVKTDEFDRYWLVQDWFYLSDEVVMYTGYKLDPIEKE